MIARIGRIKCWRLVLVQMFVFGFTLFAMWLAAAQGVPEMPPAPAETKLTQDDLMVMLAMDRVQIEALSRDLKNSREYAMKLREMLSVANKQACPAVPIAKPAPGVTR